MIGRAGINDPIMEEEAINTVVMDTKEEATNIGVTDTKEEAINTGITETKEEAINTEVTETKEGAINTEVTETREEVFAQTRVTAQVLGGPSHLSTGNTDPQVQAGPTRSRTHRPEKPTASDAEAQATRPPTARIKADGRQAQKTERLSCAWQGNRIQ